MLVLSEFMRFVIEREGMESLELARCLGICLRRECTDSAIEASSSTRVWPKEMSLVARKCDGGTLWWDAGSRVGAGAGACSMEVVWSVAVRGAGTGRGAGDGRVFSTTVVRSWMTCVFC